MPRWTVTHTACDIQLPVMTFIRRAVGALVNNQLVLSGVFQGITVAVAEQDRVDSGSLASRNIRCEERHRQHDRHDEEQSDDVSLILAAWERHLEQLSRTHARHHSNRQPHERERKSLSQDQSQHGGAVRTDGHPDADFSRTSAHRKRDETVEADDREAESHQSHAADHRNQHPENADRTHLVQRFHGAHGGNR